MLQYFFYKLYIYILITNFVIDLYFWDRVTKIICLGLQKLEVLLTSQNYD